MDEMNDNNKNQDKKIEIATKKLSKELLKRFDKYKEILPQIGLSTDDFINNLLRITIISTFVDETIKNNPKLNGITIEELETNEDFQATLKEFLKSNHDLLSELEINLNINQIPAEIRKFYLLAQSPVSNTLTKKLTSKIKNPTQLDVYGNGQIETKDFKLFIKGYSELVNGINTSAAKLLDSLLITATADGLNDTLVSLPLKEYMQMRGLKDEKEARKQVKRDMDALERIRFEYKDNNKQRGNWLSVTIAGGTHGIIKNGIIVFRFNEDFYRSLRVNENSYLFMYFPKEALYLNDNANPHSYWLARRIAEHKRMNIGKLNEDIIGIATLIEACPVFPSYEEVQRLGGHIAQRMIDPFERDMDALSDAFIWEYTGEQPSTYQEFIESNVRIIWLEYPNTKKLEEGKAKRKQQETRKKIQGKEINELKKKIKEMEDEAGK